MSPKLAVLPLWQSAGRAARGSSAHPSRCAGLDVSERPPRGCVLSPAAGAELGSMTMSRTADLGRTAELDALQAVVAPGAWSTAPADLARMSHDASHYLLTPRAV